ncbi:toxin-antitoxin system YwqK family antitoxin [Candidatus Parabeggiatoa sp. HSG14]|uniref:toxin-antitoxin system YwqK family antitoxin n=1 Tax=Candidatus Parabeggiatoa sp. HSG14 TaxID=3055593 RepID=UPI0025A8DA59|nr:toxin-antitoxin system YwqK family antitoxin [Thiotrichales bacterium HSG14]
MQSFIKIVCLAIMLFLSITAQSQETRTFYESGTVHFEYRYLNNQLHGTTKEYHESGEIKAELIYKASKLIAKKEFRRNGDIEYVLKYEDGKKVETQLEYYSSGELFRQRILVNGKRDGLEIEFYRNGKKKAERNYQNGKKEGSAKGYYVHGKLQGDWIFKNGEPSFATLYYSTGEKWLIHSDFDKDGLLNGVSKEFDKKGNLKAIRYYQDNEMVKRRRVDPWFRWWWLLWY